MCGTALHYREIPKKGKFQMRGSRGAVALPAKEAGEVRGPLEALFDLLWFGLFVKKRFAILDGLARSIVVRNKIESRAEETERLFWVAEFHLAGAHAL